MNDMPGGFRSGSDPVESYAISNNICAELSPPSDEANEILNGVKTEVEEKLGSTFSNFELVHYTTQVVAGTIFLMAVRVDDDEHLHIKIIRPLPHTGMPPSVMDVKRGKTLESTLEP